ncbi:MAG TPA: alpha/beta fold hydrolase [Polyangia bacterium]|jgi:pimeloyl-ACP methyl ester carboxylesterase
MSTRTLVLLPGMDGGDKLFGPLRAGAPAGTETIAVGYPPGTHNGYDDLLPLVRAQLPADRPFFMLGWSFSGPLALLTAAERPPHLQGVILAASFVKTPVPWLPRWARRLATPALFRFYPAASRAKALLGGYGTREVRQLLAEAHAFAGTEALACRARAALSIDASEALAACPVPVLYLRARADGVIPASRADEIRRARPSVEVADIDGPHLALVTNPTAAWEALRAFMDRVGAGR